MSVFAVLVGPRAENGYREIAESTLAPHGRVEWIPWLDDGPVAGRDEPFAAALGEADAIVSTPWLGAATFLGMPPFDAALLARAPRLRVLAGTYDFRVGWIDLVEAGRRGVIVVDTSRSMTPTVAEFALAMTLNLLRRIPEEVDSVRRGGWLEQPGRRRRVRLRRSRRTPGGPRGLREHQPQLPAVRAPVRLRGRHL